MRAITSECPIVRLAALVSVVVACAASASDPENCLSCHRYRGLGRVMDDGANVRLFYVNPEYYDRAMGPHARLRCTDCHDPTEVDVVPHHTVSPVDCTRMCHLVEPDKVEVRFAHDGIAGMLDESVHNVTALETCNGLVGQPLRDGQSRCLFCHDEPTFGRTPSDVLAHEAPVGRCAVCHDAALPTDTRFYYWHVYARSRPARSHADLVRVCGVCHSNTAVRQEYDLPDVTASYLLSFHGKAMLLGSEETAGCLNCHVGPMQNVHMMQSYEVDGSPTSAAMLADTCRSSDCHPTAGRRVSDAAVHLQLATSRGIEYVIAALFILLILFTFGPSAMLTGLEMVQVVVHRHEPTIEQRRRQARRLLSDPAGKRLLKRFTPHQRVQHWVLFTCFTLLVLTGFPIKFADRVWASWLLDLFGGLANARQVHRWAGFVLLLGCVYHLSYVAVTSWRRWRRSGQGVVQTFLSLPMVMRLDDWKELLHTLGYLLFLRRSRPAGGRFSLEEKFEYFGVFWGVTLLGLTGILMWANAWTTQYLTGRVLTIALVIHSFEALLALLHVGVLHMIGVIFSPMVFPVSPAMITGDTPVEKLAEEHGQLMDDVERTLLSEVAAEEVADE